MRRQHQCLVGLNTVMQRQNNKTPCQAFKALHPHLPPQLYHHHSLTKYSMIQSNQTVRHSPNILRGFTYLSLLTLFLLSSNTWKNSWPNSNGLSSMKPFLISPQKTLYIYHRVPTMLILINRSNSLLFTRHFYPNHLEGEVGLQWRPLFFWVE